MSRILGARWFVTSCVRSRLTLNERAGSVQADLPGALALQADDYLQWGGAHCTPPLHQIRRRCGPPCLRARLWLSHAGLPTHFTGPATLLLMMLMMPFACTGARALPWACSSCICSCSRVWQLFFMCVCLPVGHGSRSLLQLASWAVAAEFADPTPGVGPLLNLCASNKLCAACCCCTCTSCPGPRPSSSLPISVGCLRVPGTCYGCVSNVQIWAWYLG